MKEEQPDSEVVERCLQGDIDAFGALVERYQAPVFRAVLHMVGNREDAREVCQQVFLKAFEHLSTFDTSRKFFSWIYRVAMNESINFLHARRTFEPLPEDASSLGNPEQAFETNERGRHVREAVMTLSENYRAVVILGHFLHCSYADAAEMLDVPEKTVRSRLFSARQILRQALTPKGGSR